MVSSDPCTLAHATSTLQRQNCRSRCDTGSHAHLEALAAGRNLEQLGEADGVGGQDLVERHMEPGVRRAVNDHLHLDAWHAQVSVAMLSCTAVMPPKRNMHEPLCHTSDFAVIEGLQVRWRDMHLVVQLLEHVRRDAKHGLVHVRFERDHVLPDERLEPVALLLSQ